MVKRKRIVWLINAPTLVAFLMVAGVALLLGCDDAQDAAVQARAGSKNQVPPHSERPSVAPLDGFSWVVPGKLAAMPVPGRDRPLDQDAAFLQESGIRVLVSLTEEPPDREVLAAHSIDQRHLPVKDFTPPTLEQMMEFVALVEESVTASKSVGVHCTAGLGRSGTMAAVYLVAEGASADEAMARVRRLRPGSIETADQEDAVRRFEEHRATIR